MIIKKNLKQKQIVGMKVISYRSYVGCQGPAHSGDCWTCSLLGNCGDPQTIPIRRASCSSIKSKL